MALFPTPGVGGLLAWKVKVTATEGQIRAEEEFKHGQIKKKAGCKAPEFGGGMSKCGVWIESTEGPTLQGLCPVLPPHLHLGQGPWRGQQMGGMGRSRASFSQRASGPESVQSWQGRTQKGGRFETYKTAQL